MIGKRSRPRSARGVSLDDEHVFAHVNDAQHVVAPNVDRVANASVRHRQLDRRRLRFGLEVRELLAHNKLSCADRFVGGLSRRVHLLPRAAFAVQVGGCPWAFR